MTRDEAKECNIRINGWDLECIIGALKYRSVNDIDTFESTTKHMGELAKILKKRQIEINKSYREYHQTLVGDMDISDVLKACK